MKRSLLFMGLAAAASSQMGLTHPPKHDIIVRGGTIYDGAGGAPFVGDVAIDRDRIVYVGPHAEGGAKSEIDAHGKAVAPGFINMLSWSPESLLVDGKGQ